METNLFNQMQMAAKRANHFAPRQAFVPVRAKRSPRSVQRQLLIKALNAVGLPNALLLWEASDDYITKIMTLEDIARGINRFIDNNRAADNRYLQYVLHWWRNNWLFDPLKIN